MNKPIKKPVGATPPSHSGVVVAEVALAALHAVPVEVPVPYAAVRRRHLAIRAVDGGVAVL